VVLILYHLMNYFIPPRVTMYWLGLLCSLLTIINRLSSNVLTDLMAVILVMLHLLAMVEYEGNAIALLLRLHR